MEDAPGHVSVKIDFCMPIANQRESVKIGYERMFAEFSGLPLPIRIMGMALALLFLPGRWFAMRTSKIPVWPEEIEAACRIEPGDPYIKDASMNPADLR